MVTIDMEAVACAENTVSGIGLPSLESHSPMYSENILAYERDGNQGWKTGEPGNLWSRQKENKEVGR